MKKFTKNQWKGMPVVTPADDRRAAIRMDPNRDMWLWQRANGHHVWAKRFHAFPYRNDLHRIMCQPPGWFKSQPDNKP